MSLTNSGMQIPFDETNYIFQHGFLRSAIVRYPSVAEAGNEDLWNGLATELHYELGQKEGNWFDNGTFARK